MNQIDILLDISEKLEQSNIPYMLTGSFAMNYYAEPRMTRDIDMVIDLKKGLEEKFITLFKNDYYIPVMAVKSSVKEEKMFNIIHNQSVIKVDFIIRKGSEYRIVEFNRRQKIRINETSVYIVSKEDLIISKLHWLRDSGSEQQKNDIINLIRSGYDEGYVEKWVKKLDLSHLFKELTDE